MGEGAGELVAEILKIVIGFGIPAIMGFCVWIVKSIYNLKTDVSRIQDNVITRLKINEARMDNAIKDLWKAEQQLRALWPHIDRIQEERKSAHG